jgi:hypothetical protein
MRAPGQAFDRRYSAAAFVWPEVALQTGLSRQTPTVPEKARATLPPGLASVQARASEQPASLPPCALPERLQSMNRFSEDHWRIPLTRGPLPP